MTSLRYVLWTLTALGCFAVAFMPPPPPPPPQHALPRSPDIVATVEQQGGALLDLVDMPAANFDQVVFFDMAGTIVFGLVVNGCVISSPVAIGKMREATPA